MGQFATTLAKRGEIAAATMAFQFARPAGFDFCPGQAIDLELGTELRHAFSLVSAPFERELTIATRMRDSAFKQALRSLPVGATVTIEGPFGSLALPAVGTAAAVLIAGGIGITPFVSLLRQRAHDRSSQPLTLVYSNRRPEDAAFLGELQALARRDPNFRLVATMTQARNSSASWQGETGPVDETLLRKVVGDPAAASYCVVGPPAMAEAVRATLQFVGVEAAKIVTEEFYGY